MKNKFFLMAIMGALASFPLLADADEPFQEDIIVSVDEDSDQEAEGAEVSLADEADDEAEQGE